MGTLGTDCAGAFGTTLGIACGGAFVTTLGTACGGAFGTTLGTACGGVIDATLGTAGLIGGVGSVTLGAPCAADDAEALVVAAFLIMLSLSSWTFSLSGDSFLRTIVSNSAMVASAVCLRRGDRRSSSMVGWL